MLYMCMFRVASSMHRISFRPFVSSNGSGSSCARDRVAESSRDGPIKLTINMN